jgi:hypothetical protein
MGGTEDLRHQLSINWYGDISILKMYFHAGKPFHTHLPLFLLPSLIGRELWESESRPASVGSTPLLQCPKDYTGNLKYIAKG